MSISKRELLDPLLDTEHEPYRPNDEPCEPEYGDYLDDEDEQRLATTEPE